MAATASSNDTVSDGLKKIFTQISQLKLMSDAAQHMPFITMLEQGVMQYLQHVGGQMAAMGSPGGGQGAPGGGGGAGPAPAPGGAPPDAAAQFAPGGAGGGGNVGLAASPNPDELRRVLQQAGGPG